jgi:predicted TIM-barrel fold metal-dependent hydrolase
MIGTTNETQAMLVDKYPDKFRACCADQKLRLKVWRGEAKWSLEAASEEVETALKTGKFVGIGEFVPGGRRGDGKQSRIEEFRVFMDLAAKYNVAIYYHELRNYQLISRLAREYPDVPIIFCHGSYSIGSYVQGADVIRQGCSVAAHVENIYLETGTWPAEYFEIALKNPNIGAIQLVWGADYGNVPQYIVAQPKQDPTSFSSSMKRWPSVPTYQPDYWGWMFRQIHKIGEWVTQDEINLILGGNAAKIFKLPVPYSRMFPEGRPDLWGIHWEKSIPFIPRDQIINPDPEP